MHGLWAVPPRGMLPSCAGPARACRTPLRTPTRRYARRGILGKGGPGNPHSIHGTAPLRPKRPMRPKRPKALVTPAKETNAVSADPWAISAKRSLGRRHGVSLPLCHLATLLEAGRNRPSGQIRALHFRHEVFSCNGHMQREKFTAILVPKTIAPTFVGEFGKNSLANNEMRSYTHKHSQILSQSRRDGRNHARLQQLFR
jgi:hypothetical protein